MGDTTVAAATVDYNDGGGDIGEDANAGGDGDDGTCGRRIEAQEKARRKDVIPSRGKQRGREETRGGG